MFEDNGKIEGAQAANTKLIMSVVKNNGRGGYKLDLENCQFQHLETRFEEESHTRHSQGMPKRVFLHKVSLGLRPLCNLIIFNGIFLTFKLHILCKLIAATIPTFHAVYD